MDVPRIQKSSPLVDQVYEVLKQMIATNQAAPGQMLPENQLAKSLGISRAPLREALTRLEQERLVETVPWKGTWVSPLSSTYVREIYEVRIALEQLAARKAARLLTDEELDDMEQRLEAIRPSLERGDIAPQHELEIPFHRLFVEKCDNDFLRDSLGKLSVHLARILTFAGTMPEHGYASYQEHWQVLTAMRTRNPDVLETAVGNHLSNVSARLVAEMERRSGN